MLPSPPGARAGAEAEPQGARWPAALQKRNARYASLTRVDDPQGDLHERLIAHMELARVDDRLGDLEELRRKRAASHVPPRSVVYARVTREQDLGGDEDEVILASTTNERRWAETRRFRDLAGDHDELAAHLRDVRSRRSPAFEREDVIRHGTVDPNPAAEAYIIRRNEMFRDRDVDSGYEEKEEDRLLFGRDDGREDGRDDERSDRAIDAAAEKAAEKAAEDADAKAERSMDELEAATEKSNEQLQERILERQTEAQAEREEGGRGSALP